MAHEMHWWSFFIILAQPAGTLWAVVLNSLIGTRPEELLSRLAAWSSAARHG